MLTFFPDTLASRYCWFSVAVLFGHVLYSNGNWTPGIQLYRRKTHNISELCPGWQQICIWRSAGQRGACSRFFR